MNWTFTDKIVVVTGGSRGIGQSVVEQFAAAGATVVFTYASNGDAATALVGRLGDLGQKVKAVQTDVRDGAQAQALIDAVERDHGKLDVLVNNAGITRDELIMAMDEADWDDVLKTNLGGAYRMIKPAARLMMRRRQGAIVNLSSVAATRPGRGHSNYAASKGGLETMTKALAVELAGRKIRVNCVAPGVIETEMSREVRKLAGDQILARIPLSRYGQPQEIAQAVLFLASDLAAYITGAVLHVDGGLGV